MKFSISESARIVGYTRKTLYKHIDKKSIVVEKDDNGNPVIDAAELIRVYGDQCKFNFPEKAVDVGGDVSESAPVTEPEPLNDDEVCGDDPVAQVDHTQELNLVKAQAANEKQVLEEQIAYLRQSLDEQTQETRRLTMLLAELSARRNDEMAHNGQQTGGGNWESIIQNLESRVTNQEREHAEFLGEHRKVLFQNRALKKALHEERRAPLWKKVLG